MFIVVDNEQTELKSIRDECMHKEKYPAQLEGLCDYAKGISKVHEEYQNRMMAAYYEGLQQSKLVNAFEVPSPLLNNVVLK